MTDKLQPGRVYYKPNATPGEIENCRVCAMYRLSPGFTQLHPEAIGDDLLAFWQKYHNQHTPWTDLGQVHSVEIKWEKAE